MYLVKYMFQVAGLCYDAEEVVACRRGGGMIEERSSTADAGTLALSKSLDMPTMRIKQPRAKTAMLSSSLVSSNKCIVMSIHLCYCCCW